jgi:hypothetical protein
VKDRSDRAPGADFRKPLMARRILRRNRGARVAFSLIDRAKGAPPGAMIGEAGPRARPLGLQRRHCRRTRPRPDRW